MASQSVLGVVRIRGFWNLLGHRGLWPRDSAHGPGGQAPVAGSHHPGAGHGRRMKGSGAEPRALGQLPVGAGHPVQADPEASSCGRHGHEAGDGQRPLATRESVHQVLVGLLQQRGSRGRRQRQERGSPEAPVRQRQPESCGLRSSAGAGGLDRPALTTGAPSGAGRPEVRQWAPSAPRPRCAPFCRPPTRR